MYDGSPHKSQKLHCQANVGILVKIVHCHFRHELAFKPIKNEWYVDADNETNWMTWCGWVGESRRCRDWGWWLLRCCVGTRHTYPPSPQQAHPPPNISAVSLPYLNQICASYQANLYSCYPTPYSPLLCLPLPASLVPNHLLTLNPARDVTTSCL
jgi:hypothetical protein